MSLPTSTYNPIAKFPPAPEAESKTTLKNMVLRMAKKHVRSDAPALGASHARRNPKEVSKALTALRVTDQMRDYAKLKIQIRKRLKALGIPIFSTKSPKGSEAYEALIQSTAVAINKLIAKGMLYTFDEDLKPDSFINLEGDQIGVEVWISKWSELLDKAERNKYSSVRDDCDGYTAIFLILAWAAGIPVDRLAFGVVISETGLYEQRRRKLENKQFDHAIGLYWAFGKWWCGGDTWQQETHEYKCEVSDRHMLYLYGLFDEGFKFRYSDTFKELKPLNPSTTRGLPKPKIYSKKKIEQ